MVTFGTTTSYATEAVSRSDTASVAYLVVVPQITTESWVRIPGLISGDRNIPRFHHYPESLQTGCACGIRVSSLVQELTAWTSHPQWDWASSISGEKGVDPRTSDFLRENDHDPLDPYVLGHLLIGNGRCRRTEINAA